MDQSELPTGQDEPISGGGEPQDGDDRLLARLTSEAARQPLPATRPTTPRVFSVHAEGSLDLFRETRTERPRPRVLEQIDIDDLEIEDLVEELATVAAALRRRQAA